jgi:hypothetical protein
LESCHHNTTTNKFWWFLVSITKDKECSDNMMNDAEDESSGPDNPFPASQTIEPICDGVKL